MKSRISSYTVQYINEIIKHSEKALLNQNCKSFMLRSTHVGIDTMIFIKLSNRTEGYFHQYTIKLSPILLTL